MLFIRENMWHWTHACVKYRSHALRMPHFSKERRIRVNVLPPLTPLKNESCLSAYLQQMEHREVQKYPINMDEESRDIISNKKV